MSSTNKTPNYELSQFVSSDKPAWLTDVNGDMTKIDTAIKSATDSATSANGKADANTTNIGDLSYLATTAKNTLVASINEVNSKAQTAQNSATSANTIAQGASTKITALENYLNISQFNNYTAGTCSTATLNTINIHTASNADGSLGKIYGNIDLTPNTTGNQVVTLNVLSPLRPSTTISINCIGVCFRSGNIPFLYPCDAEVEPNGRIRINAYGEAGSLHRLIVHPSLLFMKDFGDIS